MGHLIPLTDRGQHGHLQRDQSVWRLLSFGLLWHFYALKLCILTGIGEQERKRDANECWCRQSPRRVAPLSTCWCQTSRQAGLPCAQLPQSIQPISEAIVILLNVNFCFSSLSIALWMQVLAPDVGKLADWMQAAKRLSSMGLLLQHHYKCTWENCSACTLTLKLRRPAPVRVIL